jgi:hypothetical protein
MGLRSQEAVQSVQSLKTWRQALDRGDTRLTVVFGTKGGRPLRRLFLMLSLSEKRWIMR